MSFELLMKQLESMPELLTNKDLISLGLYKSITSLYSARLRGQAPDHIKFVRKILYPRDSVIKFIIEHMVSGSTKK